MIRDELADFMVLVWLRSLKWRAEGRIEEEVLKRYAEEIRSLGIPKDSLLQQLGEFEMCLECLEKKRSLKDRACKI